MNPNDEPRASMAEAPFAAGSQEDIQTRETPGAGTRTREVTRRSFFDQKQKLTEQLADTAKALRQSGDQMPNDSTAGLIRMSADTIDRMGNYLRNHSIDDLLGDAQAYARRRPWWVLGGAFIAGIAAARFLKSSGSAGSQGYGTSGMASGTSTAYPPATGADMPSALPGGPPAAGI